VAFWCLASWVSSWECLYECYVGTVGLSSDVGLVKCVNRSEQSGIWVV